jgi:hypothetical protein
LREPTSFFIRMLDLKAISRAIALRVRTEITGQGTGLFMDGSFEIANFLTEEGRQFIEGQIFAYGKNLREVCRTVSSPNCPDEIVIPQSEKQMPVIAELAIEFEQFISEIFPLPVKRCTYQMRVYEARYGGHLQHVDYAPGYNITGGEAGGRCLTPLSYSLPISWNGGTAPEFRLIDGDCEHRQSRPGSLVVFGPRVPHSHPAAPELIEPYAWLIIQSFHEGFAKGHTIGTI